MKKFFIFIFFAFVICTLSMYTCAYDFSPSSNRIYNGIDISQWQENINFNKVKNDGIDIVYIKATQGNNFIDPYFEKNYKNSKNAGLKIGVYHFLTAKNIEEAKDEADFFCSAISKKEISCKLAMDFEVFDRLSKDEINKIAKAFLERVKENTKKDVVIYSDTYNAKRTFNEELSNNYPIWIAEYDINKPSSNEKWKEWVGFQYTDKGRISGISTYVDKDYYTSDIFLSNENEIAETNHKNKNLERIKQVRVKRGDTLSKFAVKYNTTVNLIIELNNIKNKNLIYIGQILNIPYSNYNITGETGHLLYKVIKGDTLSKIAKKYNISVSELVKLNNIKNPNLIYIGETLKIKNKSYELK